MASFGCCRYSRREPSSMASVLVARLPGSPSRTHTGSGTNRRLSLVEALRLLTCGVENRNPGSAQWCRTHSSVTASGHPVTIVRKRTRLLTRRPMGHLSSAQSVTSRGTGSPEGIWAQLPWRRVFRGEARAHFTLRTCPANIFPKPACFPGGILWQTHDMEEGQSTLQSGGAHETLADTHHISLSGTPPAVTNTQFSSHSGQGGTAHLMPLHFGAEGP